MQLSHNKTLDSSYDPLTAKPLIMSFSLTERHRGVYSTIFG
ncbi:TPA: hypothetical protein ACKRTE_003567 [Providencia rettgeri]